MRERAPPAGLFAGRPLAVPALAAFAGAAVDRAVEPSPIAALFPLAAGLFLTARPSSRLAGFALTAFAAGAWHHHAYRNTFPADDVGGLTAESPRLERLLGRFLNGPTIERPSFDPLRSLPAKPSTRGLLELEARWDGGGWQPLSGRASVAVAGELTGIWEGDRVELVGWLARPPPAENPGQSDPAEYWRDRRVRAVVTVKSADAVVRLDGPRLSAARLRGLGRRIFDEHLPPPLNGIAAALVLGDRAALDRDEWDRFGRTGVVHVLVISGQHLAVVAVALALLARGLGMRRRATAILVCVAVVGFAVLSGGRPPVIRAAVLVAAVCVGVLVRRRPDPFNSLALAGLLLFAARPTDIGDPGFQMSFLCAGLLLARPVLWFRPPPDALTTAVDAARGPIERTLLAVVRRAGDAYLITLVLGLAIAPLTAWHYHRVSPVGLLIGPPVIALAALALLSGLVTLLTGMVWPAAAAVSAKPLAGCLSGIEWWIDRADTMPSGHVWVGAVPAWWVIGLFFGWAVLSAGAVRLSWRSAALAVWIIVLSAATRRVPPDGLVVTALAVGHGGCAVIEAPDGRVIVADAGSLAGPDVTRRVIAPFLWHRRIHRIDAVWLSHADLDHFNALPALLERFAVGEVVWTPSFATKETPGVTAAIAAIQRNGVGVRVVSAGERMTAGAVTAEVLHPPRFGPVGVENVRSLVVLFRHAGHGVLWTGDLEGAGLERVLGLPPPPIDVLLVPHHGSRTANPAEWIAWASPGLAIANASGPIRATAEAYAARGIPLWNTANEGAVTITSRPGRLTAEAFRGGKRWPNP